MPAAAACGGFAAESPVGKRYRSIVAWPAKEQQSKQQQMRVVSRLQLT